MVDWKWWINWPSAVTCAVWVEEMYTYMRNEDPSHSWQTSLFPWNWCWEQARVLWNTFYMKFCPLEWYRESRMQSNLHASGQPWKEPTEWVVSMILWGNSEFWEGSQHLRERAVGGALNPVQCLGTQCGPIDEGVWLRFFTAAEHAKNIAYMFGWTVVQTCRCFVRKN